MLDRLKMSEDDQIKVKENSLRSTVKQ
ncbi:uncharacterized protein METZ01_LOCUS151552 [marine metagenome]|uniref:Uncharacterized protein n=1 Tax=marine metagenome TaxID=408172 RepID=A0A382AAW5_9ZZZZ